MSIKFTPPDLAEAIAAASDVPGWEHISKSELVGSNMSYDSNSNPVSDKHGAAAQFRASAPEARDDKPRPAPALPEPKFELSVSDDGASISFKCVLSGVVSMASVSLDVSSTALRLEAPGQYGLSVALPFAVDPMDVKAKFNKKKSELSVVLLKAVA